MVKLEEKNGIVIKFSNKNNKIDLTAIVSMINAYICKPKLGNEYLYDALNSSSEIIFYLHGVSINSHEKLTSVEVEQIYFGLCKDTLNELIAISQDMQQMLKVKKSDKKNDMKKPKQKISLSEHIILDDYFTEKLKEEPEKVELDIVDKVNSTEDVEIGTIPLDMDFDMKDNYIPSKPIGFLNQFHDPKPNEKITNTFSFVLHTGDIYLYDGIEMEKSRSKEKFVLFKIFNVEFVRNSFEGEKNERNTLFIQSASAKESITSNDIKLIFSKIESHSSIPILCVKYEISNGAQSIEISPQSLYVNLQYSFIKFLMSFIGSLKFPKVSEVDDESLEEDENPLSYAVIKHFNIKVNFSLIMNEIKNMILVFKKYDHSNILLPDFIFNAMKFYINDIKKHQLLKGIKCNHIKQHFSCCGHF